MASAASAEAHRFLKRLRCGLFVWQFIFTWTGHRPLDRWLGWLGCRKDRCWGSKWEKTQDGISGEYRRIIFWIIILDICFYFGHIRPMLLFWSVFIAKQIPLSICRAVKVCSQATFLQLRVKWLQSPLAASCWYIVGSGAAWFDHEAQNYRRCCYI